MSSDYLRHIWWVLIVYAVCLSSLVKSASISNGTLSRTTTEIYDSISLASTYTTESYISVQSSVALSSEPDYSSFSENLPMSPTAIVTLDISTEVDSASTEVSSPSTNCDSSVSMLSTYIQSTDDGDDDNGDDDDETTFQMNDIEEPNTDERASTLSQQLSSTQHNVSNTYETHATSESTEEVYVKTMAHVTSSASSTIIEHSLTSDIPAKSKGQRRHHLIQSEGQSRLSESDLSQTSNSLTHFDDAVGEIKSVVETMNSKLTFLFEKYQNFVNRALLILNRRVLRLSRALSHEKCVQLQRFIKCGLCKSDTNGTLLVNSSKMMNQLRVSTARNLSKDAEGSKPVQNPRRQRFTPFKDILTNLEATKSNNVQWKSSNASISGTHGKLKTLIQSGSAENVTKTNEIVSTTSLPSVST